MSESLVALNALALIDRWRQLLIQGEKKQIDQFLENVEQRFGTLGWKRNLIVESKLNRHPDQISHFSCWVSGHDSKPQVSLCLKRATERRVRGGTYDFQDQQGSIADLAN